MMMKQLVRFLILFAFYTANVSRAEELAWETDYDKALALAKEKQKPILLDFSASWCGPCRLMETATFSVKDVQDILDNFVLVKVDFDHNPALVGKYGVHAIPACFILNQFGERVDEHIGFAGPEGFASWLERNSSEAHSDVSKNQAALDRLRSIAIALVETDMAKSDSAVDDLLKTYCAKDADDNGAGAKLIEQLFRDLTQRQPMRALPHANDRRLAVRILFTALLAEKLGADFQFDPWDNSEARASAIATWNQKLAKPN